MNFKTVAFAAAVVTVAFPLCLSAQWPDFKTPGIPRLPNGKVNINAPAPKTVDGHPDFTGLWNYPNGLFANNSVDKTATTKGGNQFGNIGAGLKDGLPLLPAAQAIVAKRKADNSKDNPDAHCLPMGLMQFHTHPEPRKMVQTPGLIVIIYEANGGIRQIFTDGRPAPNNDPQPWWYGYSTGKWEGDTLVVQTAGFRDDVWLDVQGDPLTSAGKMTERFRRPDFGHLEIEVTVEDSTMYSKPWTVTVKQEIMADTDLFEFICQENEQSIPHLTAK